MSAPGSPDDPRQTAIDAARDLLQRAVRNQVFPAAAAEVGDSRGPIWCETFGTLTFDADAAAAGPETIFDLASLTKPIATTSVLMARVAEGVFSLDDPVSKFFGEWRGADRDRVRVCDLLEHASGLPARLVDAPSASRREFEHDICAIRLEYEPRAKSIYSDLDFILLGFLLEDSGRASLADQFDAVMASLKLDRDGGLAFRVPREALARTAPTWPLEDDRRRGRWLVGEVHDNYAAALGGIAGHSGLFGTAGAVGRFARAALGGARGDASIPSPLSPPLVRRMTTKSGVPGSSRALGWDTMLPTSSCGTRLSPAAFGHVGFTGTSLWIDPRLDRYFVLLTNRVCRDGGTLDQMRDVRRAFHDAVAAI